MANFNEDPDVQKVQIDQLPTEHRRLVGNVSLSNSKENFEKIYRYFLSSLFCRPLAHISFPIAPDYADKLLEHVEKIIEEESSLVRVIAQLFRCAYRSRYSGTYTGKYTSLTVSLKCLEHPLTNRQMETLTPLTTSFLVTTLIEVAKA